jgi:catechol 2,3-dioxygenase-like lactoylglutathione lyase family enzyme
MMTRTLPKILAVLFLTYSTALKSEETAMQIAHPPPLERLGVYVLSSDMKRSEAFYRSVFGLSPSVQTEVFIGFDIAGGLFAVVSRQAFAPDAVLGGNAVPYIKVGDVEAAHGHVEAVAPEALRDAGAGVISEGPISLFKFRDPDGNLIEYFSLQTPVDGL